MGFLLALTIIIAVTLFFLTPKLSLNLVDQYISNNCPDCENISSIAIAAQIGRLDIVSLCLAFLGIGVGFFAIFSFYAVREDAERTAEEKASEVLDETLKEKFDLLNMNFESDLKEMKEEIELLKAGQGNSSPPGYPDTSGSSEIQGDE